MSGVIGGGKTPVYPGNLALNTSAYGLPIPLVYGQARTGTNLLYYNSFNQIANKSSSAGKGGTNANTSYTYTADVIFGVCEGPIASFGTIWDGQNVDTTSSLNLWANGGAIGQPVWPHLAGTPQAVPYSGMAILAGQGFSLGSSATIPNLGVEVFGLCQGTSANPNAKDADPAAVVIDLLTNPAHGAAPGKINVGTLSVQSETHTVPSSAPYQITVNGVANFQYPLDVVMGGQAIQSVLQTQTPVTGQYITFWNGISGGGTYQFSSADAGKSVTINYASFQPTLKSYSDFSQASGMWVSPVYSSPTAANSLVDSLVKNTYSEVVWSSGVMTVVPRGTVNVSGNGRSWTAPSAPLFTLTDDDFLPNVGGGSSNDPIQITRSRTSDQDNDITLTCADRLNSYASSVVERTDDGLLSRFGRRGNNKSAPEFADLNAAAVSADLQLQDGYIRNSYQFTLDARYCMLDPMDVVAVTDLSLGLNAQWVRLTHAHEQGDSSVHFTAEEYPSGTGAAAEYNIDPRSNWSPNQNSAPATITNYSVFCPPVAMCRSNGVEVWVAACADNPAAFGGFNVYLSYDNGTYAEVGSLNGSSRMGVLTAALPVGSDPDTTDVISVDLTESQGALTGGSQINADQFATACWIGGEIVSYETATLTAQYQYNLGTYLRRGAYGSGIQAHNVGAQFVRLDSQLVKIPISGYQAGVNVYIKLQPVNQQGVAATPLSQLTPIQLAISTAPNAFQCTGLTATGGLGNVSLTWSNPNLANEALSAVQIWRNTTNNFATATQIGTVAYQTATYLDNPLNGGATYFYWVVPVDLAGKSGTVSGSATATTLAGLPGGVYTGPQNLSPGLTLIASVNMTSAAVLALTSEVNGCAVLYNAGDSTTYRWNGSSYTATVSAAQVIGTLSLGSIPTIPTTQLSGQISASQIQANSIGVNQISSAYVYAGAISASQIQAGSLSGFSITTAKDTSGGYLQLGVPGNGGNSLLAYNSSGQITFSLSPNTSSMVIGGSGSSTVFECGAGFGWASAAWAGSGQFTAFSAHGTSAAADAITCAIGGLTITNGYINLTGNLSVSGSISIGSSGTIISDSGNAVLGISGGTVFLGNASHPNVSNNSWLPGSDGVYTNGSGSSRWSAMYSVNGTIQTSDARLKSVISGKELGMDFLRRLTPVAGRWNDDPDGDIHQWLMAQDVEAALAGESFAGLIKPEGEGGHYALNYAEFVPSLISAVKELDEFDEFMVSYVRVLDGRIAVLERSAE